MTGQKIGYIRVSSTDQNTGRQLEGVQLDRTFTDKVSGKDTERPALKELLAYVREGDTLVCHSMDRLARNLLDLRKLVKELTGRGVSVQFLKENMTFTGDKDSPMATLMLNILGGFAEFERSIILERQREGIRIAKANGVYKGRKHSLTAEQVNALRSRVGAGEKKAALARHFGISRETLYAYLRGAETESAKV